MRSCLEPICLAVWFAVLVAPAALRAEEAVLPNGMRIQGSLQVGPQGRFSFHTASRTFNLSQLHMVRFAEVSPRPRQTRPVHRITLTDGQHITGELIEASPNTIGMQPAWADKPLTIPRSAVLAISHPPGEIALFDEDFETDLAAWKTRGDPELSERQHQSGSKSLLLNSPRQKVEYVLPKPVEAGRLSLSYFADVAKPVGACWLLDAEFAGKESPVRVSVELAGRATPSALPVPFHPARWRRLVLEWRRDSLIVQVDDEILHHVKRDQAGPLRKVRLQCQNGPAAFVLGGAVCIDDVVLARFVDELPRPPLEPEQDCVWLTDGDQLFGTVTRADRRTVRLQARSGERTLAWADVRAIHLCRQSLPIHSSIGEHVKIGLGKDGRLDEINGVLTALDDRKLTLQHPVLGALTVDRAWLRQLYGRFFGRRIELEDAPHHLGQQLLPESPRPEGMALRRTFPMAAIPAAARLQVTVAHLPAPGDDPAVARMLARGGLRTEVFLNGRLIDYLNRHAARTSAVPQIITISLPASVIRAGDNVLELRQTVDPESGRSADCVISGLVVEIPG